MLGLGSSIEDQGAKTHFLRTLVIRSRVRQHLSASYASVKKSAEFANYMLQESTTMVIRRC
jgi:hypothetical protein